MVAPNPALIDFALAYWAPEPGWIAIPSEDGSMRRHNQYSFYYLGKQLAPLAHLHAGMNLSEAALVLFPAYGALKGWLNDPNSPIDFSRPSAEKLLAAIFELMQLVGSGAHELDVSPGEVSRLIEGLREFERFYAEELGRLDAYVVSKVGAYDTNDLVERAERAIPAELRPKVPATAITDFQMAGRCLAFNLNTAVGFHALRSCEGVMHAYLEKLEGITIKPRLPDWSAYVSRLNRARADVQVTKLLNEVRDKDRNPIMHPEDVLDHVQAIRMFGSALNAIIEMTRRI